MISQRLASPDLDRIFRGESVTGLSDWQLLERYLERRDETAFEALVTRHGSMVLGVCRRMLGGSPDAEDAFQATFLILVRRARDLGPRDAIGPWLYGVATRVAARARSQAARRRRFQAIPLEFPVPDRTDAMLDPDLIEILDQELSRLPAKYRSPLVLCYLQGRTHEEAARDLQWPVGTVKGRLARGRELLRARLGRRGFAPSAGIVGVLSSPDLKAILDRALVERTVSASVRLAAGQTVAQVVSQSVTSLVEGVLSTMLLNKIKWAALAAVATGFVFTSAAVLGRQASDPRAVQTQEIAKPTPATAEPSEVNGPAAKPSAPPSQDSGKAARACRATGGETVRLDRRRGDRGTGGPGRRSAVAAAPREARVTREHVVRASRRRWRTSSSTSSRPRRARLTVESRSTSIPSDCKKPSGASTRRSRSTSRASRCGGPCSSS